MKYDFETLINRMEQGSMKWAGMKRKNPDLPEGIVPFSTADMEFKNAPEIAEGLKEYLDTHVLGYTGATPAYYDAVVDWMKKRHNWDIQPDWIVPTQGVVPALSWSVEAFCQPGDGVIVMPPVYGPFYMALNNHQCETKRCTLINTDGYYTVDYDLLEKLASEENTKLLLFCSPHNPASRVWTREELSKIGAICHKHGVKIVSDEIHFDLIMPGYQHTVFSQAVDFSDEVIVCTAPSKTFNLAAMSTSNIIIPKEEDREAFRNVMRKYRAGGPGALGMETCRIVYTQCADWLDECIQVIESNFELAESYIKEHIPQLKVSKLEGTYLLWIDCTALGKNGDELEELMTKHNLFFNQGTFFGPEGEGFVRFNLAGPRWVIEQGLQRLKEAVAEA